jgi:CBS domain-containing protein
MQLARNLRRDTVDKLEPAEALVVAPTATVDAAITRMRNAGVGCVLICDNGKLVGLFTERDLIVRVLNAKLPLDVPIAKVMTAAPATIQTRDHIRSAVKLMKQGGHRHLPVVDENTQPVGVLSVKKVVRYLVEHYPSAIYNVPPDQEPPTAAEGA